MSSLLIMSGFVVYGFCVGPRFEWLLERASQRINIVEVKMEVIVEVVCFSFGGCRCGVGFVVLGLRCMGGGIYVSWISRLSNSRHNKCFVY